MLLHVYRRLCVGLGLMCLAWRACAHAPEPLGSVVAAAASSAHAQSSPKTPPLMKAQRVAEGVYYVQGASEQGSSANQNFISNAGFVVTPAGVVVIDALGSPELARRLLAEIAKVTRQAVHTVIVTHYHADHIYGLQVFKERGARIVAHGAARDYLSSDTARLRLQSSRQELWPWVDETTRLVSADVWLDGPSTLTVGGVRFEIRPVGPSHTAEDVVVYLPQKQGLFAGDLVFRNRIPFVGQADSRHWIEAMGDLLALNVRWLLPGHGPVSHSPQADMTLTRDYLMYLRERMGQAARDMTSFESAYASTDWSKFETMPLFKSVNRMNAYNTYLLMEQEIKE